MYIISSVLITWSKQLNILSILNVCFEYIVFYIGSVLKKEIINWDIKLQILKILSDYVVYKWLY